MFANQSGIYCLRRDQSIQYVGKFMERNWLDKVNINQLELAQGHHYGIGRAYKLSVPLSENEQDNGYQENSEVYVYNHTPEAEGKPGAWDRYTNHPATGWANLASNAFFGSTNGVVYLIRNTGLRFDYRDSDKAIEFRLDTRPNDFGNSGVRKVVDQVIIHYRVGAYNQENTLKYSIDLAQEYSDTTALTLPANEVGDGMSSTPGRDIQDISHSLGKRRGVYFSLRLENVAIDEDIEVVGIDFRVGGLETAGIKSATDSNKK
jgi:hypothetical protein